MLLLLLACAPATIVQDTGALQAPCEPNVPVFDMPIGAGSSTVAVEHHLGLCTDQQSATGRLTVRRTTPDATCTAILTFVGEGETDCPSGCTGAWAIGEQLLESDCEGLEELTLGPEDLVISPWVGWSIDGTVHGENVDGLVELPARSNDFTNLVEGPESWLDVYGAILVDR